MGGGMYLAGQAVDAAGQLSGAKVPTGPDTGVPQPVGIAAANTTSVSRVMPIGSTVIRRDTFRGRVWTAYPTRVVEHSDQGLVLAHWPGVRVLVPTTWTAWLQGAGHAARAQLIPDLARGTWKLDLWTWHTTHWLHMFLPGQWFSVNAVIDGARGELRYWYINFQRPYECGGANLDTFDLFLDLVVDPDLTLRWKDEAEYEQARCLGVVSDAEAREVDRAREVAVALVRAQGWPFGGPWATWRADPAWPLPALGDAPPGGDRLPS